MSHSACNDFLLVTGSHDTQAYDVEQAKYSREYFKASLKRLNDIVHPECFNLVEMEKKIGGASTSYVQSMLYGDGSLTSTESLKRINDFFQTLKSEVNVKVNGVDRPIILINDIIPTLREGVSKAKNFELAKNIKTIFSAYLTPGEAGRWEAMIATLEASASVGSPKGSMCSMALADVPASAGAGAGAGAGSGGSSSDSDLSVDANPT